MLDAADKVKALLVKSGIRVHIDGREGIKPGAKYYEWETRGVPFRFELGPRDVTAGTVMLARRTGGGKEALPMEGIGPRMVQEVERMQHDLLNTQILRREHNSFRHPESKQAFIDYLENGGGFVYAGWCGDPAVEAEIKEQTKATIRVIPDAEFRSSEAPKTCIWTGRPAVAEVVWARAY